MNLQARADLHDLVIAPEATLRDCIAQIDATGMEVAFCCDETGRLLSVITDGDIRRALLRGHQLHQPVAGVGSTTFTALPVGADRRQALSTMLGRRIKCVPVVDELGCLVDLHTLHTALLGQRNGSWAVIMAGGFGTRLGELTTGVPKPMLPIGDRPILEHIVNHLVSQGIRRIFLSTGYLGRMIEDHFGDGSRFFCDIDYLREDEPLGTGGALSLLPERPSAPLVVMNGDLLTNIGIARMLAFHRAGEFAMTVALREHSVEVPFGVAEVDDMRVLALQEKPKLHYRINAGIYVIEPAMLERVPPHTCYPITNLLTEAIDCAGGVGAYPMQEQWTDVGLPAEFSTAQRLQLHG